MSNPHPSPPPQPAAASDDAAAAALDAEGDLQRRVEAVARREAEVAAREKKCERVNAALLRYVAVLQEKLRRAEQAGFGVSPASPFATPPLSSASSSSSSSGHDDDGDDASSTSADEASSDAAVPAKPLPPSSSSPEVEEAAEPSKSKEARKEDAPLQPSPSPLTEENLRHLSTPPPTPSQLPPGPPPPPAVPAPSVFVEECREGFSGPLCLLVKDCIGRRAKEWGAEALYRFFSRVGIRLRDACTGPGALGPASCLLLQFEAPSDTLRARHYLSLLLSVTPSFTSLRSFFANKYLTISPQMARPGDAPATLVPMARAYLHATLCYPQLLSPFVLEHGFRKRVRKRANRVARTGGGGGEGLRATPSETSSQSSSSTVAEVLAAKARRQRQGAAACGGGSDDDDAEGFESDSAFARAESMAERFEWIPEDLLGTWLVTTHYADPSPAAARESRSGGGGGGGAGGGSGGAALEGFSREPLIYSTVLLCISSVLEIFDPERAARGAGARVIEQFDLRGYCEYLVGGSGDPSSFIDIIGYLHAETHMAYLESLEGDSMQLHVTCTGGGYKLDGHSLTGTVTGVKLTPSILPGRLLPVLPFPYERTQFASSGDFTLPPAELLANAATAANPGGYATKAGLYELIRTSQTFRALFDRNPAAAPAAPGVSRLLRFDLLHADYTQERDAACRRYHDRPAADVDREEAAALALERRAARDRLRQVSVSGCQWCGGCSGGADLCWITGAAHNEVPAEEWGQVCRRCFVRTHTAVVCAATGEPHEEQEAEDATYTVRVTVREGWSLRLVRSGSASFESADSRLTLVRDVYHGYTEEEQSAAAPPQGPRWVLREVRLRDRAELAGGAGGADDEGSMGMVKEVTTWACPTLVGEYRWHAGPGGSDAFTPVVEYHMGADLVRRAWPAERRCPGCLVEVNALDSEGDRCSYCGDVFAHNGGRGYPGAAGWVMVVPEYGYACRMRSLVHEDGGVMLDFGQDACVAASVREGEWGTELTCEVNHSELKLYTQPAKTIELRSLRGYLTDGAGSRADVVVLPFDNEVSAVLTEEQRAEQQKAAEEAQAQAREQQRASPTGAGDALGGGNGYYEESETLSFDDDTEGQYREFDVDVANCEVDDDDDDDGADDDEDDDVAMLVSMWNGDEERRPFVERVLPLLSRMRDWASVKSQRPGAVEEAHGLVSRTAHALELVKQYRGRLFSESRASLSKEESDNVLMTLYKLVTENEPLTTQFVEEVAVGTAAAAFDSVATVAVAVAAATAASACAARVRDRVAAAAASQVGKAEKASGSKPKAAPQAPAAAQSRPFSPNLMRHLANHTIPRPASQKPQVLKPQLVYRNENGTPFRTAAPSCSTTSKDVSEYFLSAAARHLLVDLEKPGSGSQLPNDEPAAAVAASKPEEHAKSAHSKKATKAKKKGGNGKKKRK